MHRKLSRASRRLLDSQLSQLVEQGILAKTSVNQKPLKVEYQLTPLGETLILVIELTAQWGKAIVLYWSRSSPMHGQQRPDVTFLKTPI